MTRGWRLLVAMLAGVTLVAAGCGGEGDGPAGGEGGGEGRFPAGTTMARLQQEGEITIGVKFDVPPFGFKNPTTNEVEGFDVDLGKAIAEELGVEPRFIEAISDNRIPFLQNGTVDLILSTMTITTDRDAEIDFSEPYYIAQGRILVPGDSDIAGVDDLAGRSICTVTGSTYEETVKEEAPEADLRLVDTYSECYELIQTGAVEAVSTDDVILTGMIIQDRNADEPLGLELVGDELTVEPYGAGIKDGDTEFQEFVNQVLASLEQDGRWQDLFDQWVGQYTGQDQQPPDMTLEEALELRPCEETC